MKWVNLLLVLLILITPSGHANTIFNRETVSKCIVFIVNKRIATTDFNDKEAEIWLRYSDSDEYIPKTENIYGSGFFVSNNNVLFLVTASHVAKSMTMGSNIMIMGKNGESTPIPILQLNGNTDKLNWIHHSEADVAVLELNPSIELFNSHLQNRFLPYEILFKELKAPSRTIPLIVFGFPLGIGVSNKFSPLTKQTHCASEIITLKRFDKPINTEFFILEDPSVEGYSGGPVFDLSVYNMGAITTTGSGTQLYGLIHGTSSDNTGGKLAAVVPCYFIVQTIQNALNAK
ncbi:serine protease [Candidatus Latescibacterota bacterium]